MTLRTSALAQIAIEMATAVEQTLQRDAGARPDAEFAALLAEDRQHQILRLLSWAPGCTAPAAALARGLQVLGHRPPTHVLRNDLDRLAELRLIQRPDPEVATLTAAGLDAVIAGTRAAQ